MEIYATQLFDHSLVAEQQLDGAFNIRIDGTKPTKLEDGSGNPKKFWTLHEAKKELHRSHTGICKESITATVAITHFAGSLEAANSEASARFVMKRLDELDVEPQLPQHRRDPNDAINRRVSSPVPH